MTRIPRNLTAPRIWFVKNEDGSVQLVHERCPLCGMVLTPGPSLSRHHLVPQLKGGGDWSIMHEVCHGKIHSLWSENELRDIFKGAGNADRYWQTIANDERIQKFRRFVRKQFERDPEYVDSNKLSNDHKKRRR